MQAKNPFRLSNSKYDELFRVICVKCEVQSSNPLANRGDMVRMP